MSELLQSQLRQPLGLNTLQPQLLRDPQFKVETSGLTQAGANEFNPLFTRNQVAAQVDTMAGSAGTAGDQIFVSGLKDTLAWSLGQYRFQTQGQRENNDQRQDLLNAFVQLALSPTVRLQAELRSETGKQGDLAARFDRTDFAPKLRDDTRLDTFRAGGWFALDARSELMVSAIAGTSREHLYLTDDPSYDIQDRERLQSAEVQYAQRSQGLQFLSGVSLYRNQATLDYGAGPFDADTRERSVYAQAVFTNLPHRLMPLMGISWDTYDEPGVHVSRVNPKLGLAWPVSDAITMRAAAFTTVKRSFVANQTLQPAQIMGFNQFFDDPNGTRTRRVGVALDHKLTSAMFVGAEASARDLDVPGFPGDPDARWRERFGRLYAYRIFSPNASATLEVQGERFVRPEKKTGNEGYTRLRTVFVPLGLRLHALGNWLAGVKVTWISQQIQYQDRNYDLVDARSNFVVTDLNAYYRLPQRIGIVSIEARNVFNRRFSYQDIDNLVSPRYAPGRVIVMRLSVAF